jgi:hypothetical protein
VSIDAPPLGSYPFNSPGEPIVVFEGLLAVGGLAETTGRLWCQFDCDLQLLWEVATERSSMPLGETTLHLSALQGMRDVAIPGHVMDSRGKGVVRSARVTTGEPLKRVITHWVNLPTILPADPLSANGAIWGGRWRVSGGGWTFVLDQRPDLSQCLDTMRNSKKNLVTHVGDLRRSDDSEFSPDEALETIFCIQMAFSFALGRWSAPALPVGYGASGAVAWWECGAWRCDPFYGYFSWWDTHTGDDLAMLVEAFLTRWQDADQRNSLRYLAMHSMGANQSGTSIEARMMLAQAGLEYLSWVKNVLEGNRSARVQKGMSASTRLREILAEARIPLAIPDELTELHRYRGTASDDGPIVVTGLRNRLVHPRDTEEPYRIEGALGQAWLLLMHYLNLAILYRLNYSGHYLEPFPPGRFAHSSGPVPWVP